MSSPDVPPSKPARPVANENLRRLGVLVVIGGFIAFMFWDLGQQHEIECNVCMTFNNLTRCEPGSGATKEEAIRAGQTPACKLLVNGVTQAFQCEATPPSSVQCGPAD